MAKSSKKKDKKLPKSLRKGALPRPVGDVWAAGVGALAAAGKKGTASFESLVALGSSVVETGSDAARGAAGQVGAAADSLAGTARGLGGSAVDGVLDGVEGVVESVLGKIGVPGRDEVVALQAQVDALQARIDALRAQAAPAPADVPAVAPEPDDAEPAASEPDEAQREVAVYEVAPHERGWAVRKAGVERATSVHGTKKEALADGRRTARAHAPSRLIVYKADGSVADETGY